MPANHKRAPLLESQLPPVQTVPRPDRPPAKGRVPATGILGHGLVMGRQAWAIEALESAAVAVLLGDTEAFREWLYFPADIAVACAALGRGEIPEDNGQDVWRVDAFDDGDVLANPMAWGPAAARLAPEAPHVP